MPGNTTRSAIRRKNAEKYILTSLVGFAVTVILTRAFLEITGYPQIGNNVLHIAHALWGGLFLIIAAYLPLAFANRWAFQASAVLSGIGVGLFIDEIGKFITQANDYFFPPALPLIYGFILLNVLVYLYFRRPHKEDPRCAMYHALEGMQDLLDGDLDTTETTRIDDQLAIARQSDRVEIVSLANHLSKFLQREKGGLPAVEPSFLEKITLLVEKFGLRIGRRVHRAIITLTLIGWVILVIGYLMVIVRGGDHIDPLVSQWSALLVFIQVAVGILIFIAMLLWLVKKEKSGLTFAVSGFLVSLVALQILYFYLSQFMAITVTLLQFAVLLVLYSYNRWYLIKDQ